MQSIPPQRVKKIAIRLPNWLGDIVMATSFVDLCLRLFPNARIDLYVTEQYMQFPFPAVCNRLPIPKKRWSIIFWQRIRQQTYDLYFILPLSFSAALIAFLTPARHRIGYKSELRNWLLTHAIDLHNKRSQHVIQEWVNLLNNYYEKTFSYNAPCIPINLPAESQKAQQPLVLIAPFSAYGPSKNWPINYYQQIAQKHFDLGWRVIVLGTKKDAPQVPPNKCWENWCGKTSLLELFQIIKKATLLIANDSGIRHIAGALGVKNIGIYGSSNPSWTGPLDENSVVFYRKEICSPCYQKTCQYGHYHCLTKIHPEEIWEKEKSMIANLENQGTAPKFIA